MRFLIQGSSKSWSGDVEHCVNILDGKPAIFWTIKRIYENFENAIIQIIAPEYDRNGELEFLKKDFKDIEIFYGYNENPLKRMIAVTENIDGYFIRLNALNFLFDIDFIKDMYDIALKNDFDCVKMRDDYPVHFVGEVYKISAICKLEHILNTKTIENSSYHVVHPKFLLMRLDEFNSFYYIPKKEIPEVEVNNYINKMKQIMQIERLIVDDSKRISSGDQLTFHYELAEKFLDENDILKGSILDIACGTGYGSVKFSNKFSNVYGADYDFEQILENREKYKHIENLIFQQEDIMSLSFESNKFDVILSMETIEHVDPHKALNELRRVLKKGGYLILSTPQNSSSSQCVNPVHLYEYSLNEIRDIISEYFEIEKIIGLKAGKIYFEDDLIGSNTVIFAKNQIKIEVK